MVFRKKEVEATILTAAFVALAGMTTATTEHSQETAAVTVTEQQVCVGENGTAGVILRLHDVAESTMQSMFISMEQTSTGVVAVGDGLQEETAADTNAVTAEAETIDGTTEQTETVDGAVEETVDPIAQEWANKVVPNVDKYLNVRAEASEDSDVVGKLYVGSAADIVEQGDTWTHITSGLVDGYVMNAYCLTGMDAYNNALSNCDITATALTGGLRVRENPSEEAGIVDTIAEGDVLTVDTAMQTDAEWVAVSYKGSTNYVSAQYVQVALDVDTAVTPEEEEAKLKEEAKTTQVSASGNTTQNAATAANVDEVTLLAALIQGEAGAESYEGQLAVGAVVMNRLRSGRYGTSISAVIYAPGQFTPAGSGTVARILANGVKASCLAAAQEALNGSDNTGGATSFRSVWSGHPGIVIGNHVFW